MKENAMYQSVVVVHRNDLQMIANRLGLSHEDATTQSVCHALAECRAKDNDPKLSAGRGFLRYVEALRAERDQLLLENAALKLKEQEEK